jgi:NAD(P)-dependent dehydrogenase (short-subunit alcohol dehydrogenase family)
LRTAWSNFHGFLQSEFDGHVRKVDELIKLTDRRALVVGGAGHIGSTAVETLAELGTRIAILDRSDAMDGSTVRDLEAKFPGQIETIECDLRDADATRGAVRKSISALAGLDIIVHCAAYVGTTQEEGWTVPFEQQTADAFSVALHVNLTSAFIIVQEARGALSVSSQGSVILFGSIYGIVSPDFSIYYQTSMTNPVGYGCSKGGLLQLMRYLSSTLAPEVRVNMISPGGVERGQPAQFRSRYYERTPMKRMATEEDMKGAVAYLASDMSAYVTGHNLIVDGGWTVW